MRFESQKDLERETKAIKTFCAAYNLNFEKQSDWDVDFVVFNSEYRTHVEVKGNDLIGEIKKGGRKPRQGSSNDIEIMAYYPKQESIKVLKYNP